MGPRIEPEPKIAVASAVCSGGNASSMIEKDTGSSAPPPIPCRMQKKTSDGRLQELPHSIEAATNAS